MSDPSKSDPQKLAQLAAGVRAAKTAGDAAKEAEAAALAKLNEGEAASRKAIDDFTKASKAKVRTLHDAHAKAVTASATAATALDKAQADLDQYIATTV